MPQISQTVRNFSPSLSTITLARRIFKRAGCEGIRYFNTLANGVLNSPRRLYL